MERLLTKCCRAKRVVDTNDIGFPIRIYCEECGASNPTLDWVEVDDESI